LIVSKILTANVHGLLGRCENLVPKETQALLRAGCVDKGRDLQEASPTKTS